MTLMHPPDHGRGDRLSQLDRSADKFPLQARAVTPTLTGEALWLPI
jgi:hypothetical protein